MRSVSYTREQITLLKETFTVPPTGGVHPLESLHKQIEEAAKDNSKDLRPLGEKLQNCLADLKVTRGSEWRSPSQLDEIEIARKVLPFPTNFNLLKASFIYFLEKGELSSAADSLIELHKVLHNLSLPNPQCLNYRPFLKPLNCLYKMASAHAKSGSRELWEQASASFDDGMTYLSKTAKWVSIEESHQFKLGCYEMIALKGLLLYTNAAMTNSASHWAEAANYNTSLFNSYFKFENSNDSNLADRQMLLKLAVLKIYSNRNNREFLPQDHWLFLARLPAENWSRKCPWSNIAGYNIGRTYLEVGNARQAWEILGEVHSSRNGRCTADEIVPQFRCSALSVKLLYAFALCSSTRFWPFASELIKGVGKCKETPQEIQELLRRFKGVELRVPQHQNNLRQMVRKFEELVRVQNLIE